MSGFNTDPSIEGDFYIRKLSTYIKRNEEGLANGLLLFSKQKSSKVKPTRLSFSLHHLYYISEKIDNSSLGVDVGPLNIRLDSPNHEPTFISFMANNARNSKNFDSDARSISSINSMRSIVSNASVFWRNFNTIKDPKILKNDIKYLYSSFTKIPCLILSPKTKTNAIQGYEEFPCDTSVPLRMFKNLQVLEIIDYEPNEIFGWNVLSDQLRILIIKNSKLSDLTELIYSLVNDDENNRNTFTKPLRRSTTNATISVDFEDFKLGRHGAGSKEFPLYHTQSSHNTLSQFSQYQSKDFQLKDSKWSFLRQLTVMETSITSIPPFTFKPLTNLVKLNLSNNLLEDIPEGLSYLVNVRYINLSDNYITNLKRLPTNLKHLTTLNFNNNKLISLEGLENLHSLEKIDLRKNNLDSINSLKPILYSFIKLSESFNNVYLIGNKLPKSYRIDLFNLINGIKFKNDFRIDDTRPGYFESAMLLDNEAAIRNLHHFFRNPKQPAQVQQQQSLQSLSQSVSVSINELDNSIGGLALEDHKPLSPNQNVTNTSDKRSSSKSTSDLKKSPTVSNTLSSNLSDTKNNPTSMVTQVQVTARMST